MRFTPQAVNAIRERKKSQCRWPRRTLAEGLPKEHLELVCPFAAGRVYKAQAGRGLPSHEITVLTAVAGKLGDVGQGDLGREGYKFLAEFKRDWVTLHGDYQPGRDVWVITFAVGDVRDLLDNPKLLAARPGRSEFRHGEHGQTEIIAHGGDYTSDPMLAMVGEPEAIPTNLTTLYTTEADDRYRRGATQGLHGSVARIEEEIELARQHMNTTSQSYGRKVTKALRDLEHQRKVLAEMLEQDA